MTPEPAGFAPPDPAALFSIFNTYYACKVYITFYPYSYLYKTCSLMCCSRSFEEYPLCFRLRTVWFSSITYYACIVFIPFCFVQKRNHLYDI